MPDSYIHVHVAFHALLRAHQSVASLPCYFSGANGADVFCNYQIKKSEPTPNLVKLCTTMHEEKTGLFLKELVMRSLTPQQQSYTLGYITHYVTDCIVNPYISAMGDAGLFRGRRGRLAFEASLDSMLFYENFRIYAVPPLVGTPLLLNEDLAQVSRLLHDCVLSTYETEIESVHFADAFHENLHIRKKMYSPLGVKKTFLNIISPLLFDKKRSEDVLLRMQPGAKRNALPQKWKNPYTLQDRHCSFEEVLTLAMDAAAVAVVAAMQYWLLEIDETTLQQCLGNMHCHTGLPLQP